MTKDDDDLGRGMREELERRRLDPGSASVDAAALLCRAGRRVRWWGRAALLLWLLVAGGTMALCYSFFVLVYPKLFQLAVEGDGAAEGSDHALRESLRLIPQLTLVGTALWAGVLALAAVSTVLFVSASRKATLHELHGRLAEISQQLRQLASDRGA